MDIPLFKFFHKHTEVYLGCFWFMVIMNLAALNIIVQVFVQTYICIFLDMALLGCIESVSLLFRFSLIVLL